MVAPEFAERHLRAHPIYPAIGDTTSANPWHVLGHRYETGTELQVDGSVAPARMCSDMTVRSSVKRPVSNEAAVAMTKVGIARWRRERNGRRALSDSVE